MIAPASDAVARQFGVTNNVLIAMTTSIFVLAYGEEFVILLPRYAYLRAAIGPLFLAPLSELYGRSRVLQLANMFYLGMYLLRRAYATFLLIGLFSMEPSLWFCKKRNTVDHFSIFGWN